MTRSQAIEKAKKIQELAVRGSTEGERTAAKQKLEQFMAKHDLKASDLLYRTNQAPRPKATKSYHTHNPSELEIPPEVLKELQIIGDILFRAIFNMNKRS